MGELLIRPFEARDQEAARLLIINGLGEHFGYIDESLNPDLDDILQSYVLAGDVFLVAYVGEMLVGTGALISLEDGTSEMVRVSTHVEYRRRGIGTAIVTRLLSIARQRGDRRIILTTRQNWVDALNLYKGLGFVEYGRTATRIDLEKVAT
jgi:ribosomal protein S18 acetylase RimI-like enzyme